MILAKDSAIKDLKIRLSKQKEVYKKQLDNKEIHMLQERYIAQNYLEPTIKNPSGRKVKR